MTPAQRDERLRSSQPPSFEEVEARLRSLGDSAPVLLWMSARDGRCIFFNQRWLEFTGRTLDEEVGDGWAELIHPEDFQNTMDTYFDSFVVRRAFRMEYRLRRADGAYRWVLDTGIPRHAPNGDFEGYIGSCIDVTDFKDANEELRKLKEQLEDRVEEAQQAIEARDEFLSIASHELRTPLSALVLQLSALRSMARDSSVGGDDKVSRKVDSAFRATTRLTALVDSLLDVTRLTKDTVPLELDETDLVDLVRRAADRCVDVATRAGCVIRCHALEPIEGAWDRRRLEQVFENLLANAIKYGAGYPIDVTATKSDGLATVTVRDQGIGIAQEDIGRIFDRFERAAPARHYGGLGLGLYIVRANVEAHGGSVRVTSEVGRGATFEVELPRRPAPSEAT